MDEVLVKLKEKFSVYITQVSFDERIAQNCRELKSEFDEVEKYKDKYTHFATISFKKTYEEESEFYQNGIQAKYESLFGDHIIPFSKDGETLSAIIDRANKKLPPFSSAKDASDNGFKDCILWLSLLAYFKDNGESEIIFVTDDRGAFINHKEKLENEFHEVTGKALEIHPNAYYTELIRIMDSTNAVFCWEKENGIGLVQPKMGHLENMDLFRIYVLQLKAVETDAAYNFSLAHPALWRLCTYSYV